MPNSEKILVVEDEATISRILSTVLTANGYQVLNAENGQQALSMASSHCPDLILLDLGLPGMDGIEVIRRLREWSGTPILVVSARDQEEEKVRAFDLGADDYITKPFLPREMTLRLGAVLRRTYGAAGEGGVIYLGPVTVEMETGVVSGNGPDRTLTAKEYALLSALNENRGRIVTVDALCMAAWRGENMGYENTLMVHMRRLREKIEPDPSHPCYLVTVRGLGYRLLKEDGR